MTLEETLIQVWRQALQQAAEQIEIEGTNSKVGRTRGKGLRIVEFSYAGKMITGIEQNPATSSRWAEMARQGMRVMQFSCGGRYFANVAEGKVMKYSAWTALGLPD
jgi:hypothetical protein